MSKQQQKKVVQINHALSGYHGEQLRKAALQIYQTRKDILKKLQRKKKLAAVISDQLYSYLQKFPQQKMGLHQQSFKKKKAKLLQADQKIIYNTPLVQYKRKNYFSLQPKQELTKLSHIFAYPLADLNSQSNQ